MRHEDAKRTLQALAATLNDHRKALEEANTEGVRIHRENGNQLYGALRDDLLKVSKHYKHSITGGVKTCYERAFGNNASIHDLECVIPHINQIIGRVNDMSTLDWIEVTKSASRATPLPKEKKVDHGDLQSWAATIGSVVGTVGTVVTIITGIRSLF